MGNLPNFFNARKYKNPKGFDAVVSFYDDYLKQFCSTTRAGEFYQNTEVGF